MSDLEIERARRADDNATVSPVQLLKMIIDDIEKGDLQCDGLVVFSIYREDKSAPNKVDFETYRCGMNRMDEIATIALGQEKAIRDWLD